MTRFFLSNALVAALLVAGSATAITLDGQNIPTEPGLTLLATQDTPTGFGDATGGGQDSTGGSELNQLFANVNATTQKLELGITGNLEGNFNKMWIFFDAVDGGENVLAGDNQSGGFNQITAMTGMTFPAGITMDHGLQLEVGDGFYGVRFFDLITNTAVDVATGGGPGDLPLSNVNGAKGVDFGWDNSNVAGVDGTSAASASTATTGFEFEIDIVEAFNGSQGTINMVAFVSNGDANFLSNQFLPGLAGAANPGDPTVYTVPGVASITGPVIDSALPGDVDGDGNIDLVESIMNGDGISDFDIISMNWLETNATFGSVLGRGDGDLNENGEVGIEDFREWKNAWLAQGGDPILAAQAFASLGSATVPEPSTVVLTLVVGASLLFVRRRSA